jgi:hypothetical protein
MKKEKLWLFLFDKDTTPKEACCVVIIGLSVLICTLLFTPNPANENMSFYGEIKQKVSDYFDNRAASQSEKQFKDETASIDGYSFVRFYHLVVADTKKDQAYYYGEQAAVLKGEKNYILCYKSDGKIKKLPFKNWNSGHYNGIIVEDGSIVRFSYAYPEEKGCEFDFCRDGAFCEFYFNRKL